MYCLVVRIHDLETDQAGFESYSVQSLPTSHDFLLLFCRTRLGYFYFLPHHEMTPPPALFCRILPHPHETVFGRIFNLFCPPPRNDHPPHPSPTHNVPTPPTPGCLPDDQHRNAYPECTQDRPVPVARTSGQVDCTGVPQRHPLGPYSSHIRRAPMSVLGGVQFLMSEVPLYQHVRHVQGYLAHKKHPPPLARTTIWP